MQATSRAFKENTHRALRDADLQAALAKMRQGFVERRATVVRRLPEFDALRDQARAIKDHPLANLDFYLARFEGSPGFDTSYGRGSNGFRRFEPAAACP